MKRVRFDAEDVASSEVASDAPVKKSRKTVARSVEDDRERNDDEFVEDVDDAVSVPLSSNDLGSGYHSEFNVAATHKRYYLTDDYEDFGEDENEDNFDEDFDEDFMNISDDEFCETLDPDEEDEEEFADDLNDESPSIDVDEFDDLNTEENFFEGDDEEEDA